MPHSSKLVFEMAYNGTRYDVSLEWADHPMHGKRVLCIDLPYAGPDSHGRKVSPMDAAVIQPLKWRDCGEFNLNGASREIENDRIIYMLPKPGGKSEDELMSLVAHRLIEAGLHGHLKSGKIPEADEDNGAERRSGGDRRVEGDRRASNNGHQHPAPMRLGECNGHPSLEKIVGALRKTRLAFSADEADIQNAAQMVYFAINNQKPPSSGNSNF